MFTELSLLPQKRQTYAQFSKRSCPIIKQSALAKFALLDIWHQLCTSGQTTLSEIQNFLKKYQVNHAIEWYKNESFLYRCVNEALNTDNIEQNYLLHSYIADLHEEIHRFKRQSHAMIQTAQIKSSKTILYRGARQSDEELNILKSLEGKLVTNKSFMLTSRNKKVALNFALLNNSHASDSLSLLYEIHIDLNSPNAIYADITGSQENNINDILLDFDIRFRLKQCKFDTTDNIWLCCLEATHEEPDFMHQYQAMPLSECLAKLNSSKNEDTRVYGTLQSTRQYSSNFNASKLLLSNKQWKLPVTCRPIEWAHIVHIKALIEWQRNSLSNKWIHAIQIYAQSDIQYLSDNLNIAYCLNHFGYIKHLLDKNSLAIQLIKTSLCMCQRRLAPEHIFFPMCYQNLGIVFANLGDYMTALEYHKRALSITQQLFPAIQWTTVLILRNMATICDRSGHRSEAHRYRTQGNSVYKKYMDFLIKNNYLISEY
jgi:hypothetical protein